MKKFIKTFILAIGLILPSLFYLTACGDKKNEIVVSISVQLASDSPYTLANGEITVEYGEKVEIGDSDFVITATMNDDETQILSLKSDFNKSGYIFSSTIPSSGITPIGEYLLTIGHENLLESDFITIKVNVVKKVVDVNSLNLTWLNDERAIAYNGQPKKNTITNLPEYLEAEYYNNTETRPSTYFSVASIKVKEEYIDRYFIEKNENTILHKWTIVKGSMGLPNIDYSDVMEKYTYDGTSKTAKVKDEVLEQLTSKNISVELTGTTIETNAGKYRVKISFVYTGDDKDCYNLEGPNNDRIGSVNTIWTIEKILIDVSGVSLKVVGGDAYINALTYNGYERKVVFDLNSLKNEINYVYNFVGDSTCPLESPTMLPTIGTRILYAEATGTFGATDVGEYTVIITFTIHNDYLSNYKFSNTTENSTTVTKTWRISKADLVLAVNDRTNANAFTYGDAISYSSSDVCVTGLVGDDTLDILGELSFVYSATVDGVYTPTISRDSGMYYAKVDALTSNNYSITYTAGVLEIKKATLTITPENKTFTYGGSGTGNVTIEGYKYDDENALQQQIDYALTIEVGTIVDERFVKYEDKVVVGEYLYKVSGLDNLANYTPNYIYGTMTITPSPLTLTLSTRTGDNALTYGDEILYSSSDVCAEGLVNWESIESLGNFQVVYALSQTGTFNATPKNAGTYYAKVAELEPNDSNRNYNITYNVSQLEIKKAVITAEVQNAQWNYGEITGIAVNMSGFKYNESTSVRYDNPNYVSIRRDPKYYNIEGEQYVRPDGSYLPVGTYRYEPCCSARNYTFEYVYQTEGNLVVVPKNIEISASLENSLEYGDELLLGNVKYSYYSIKIGESEGGLTYTANYTQGSPAGEYTITACGLIHSSNYIVTYSPTTFTVLPKNIKITPIAQKIVYGNPVTLGVNSLETITSWVKEEDSSVLNGLSFEYRNVEDEEFSSTIPINAGSYKYRVNTRTLSSTSYTFTSEEADYIIERRPIKITIGDATAEYGSDFSELDILVTYGGMVYYDTREKKYVEEHLAFGFVAEGQEAKLRENIVAIDTSFAYNDDKNLFASIEEFKFGSFSNDVFEPYDKSASDWDFSAIFLAIDRPIEGPDLTNAIDNYLILNDKSGILTITKKTLTRDDFVWQANGVNIEITKKSEGEYVEVERTSEAINFAIDTSQWGSALSISYKYEKNSSDSGSVQEGDLTTVSEIKDLGHYIVTATITLSDEEHYTLALGCDSLVLNVDIVSNPGEISFPNESIESASEGNFLIKINP